MTSGNVANIGPNVMVNNKMSAKEEDNSYGFIDVMNKSVANKDNKNDTLRDYPSSASANRTDDLRSNKVDAAKASKSDDTTSAKAADKTDKTGGASKGDKASKPDKADKADKSVSNNESKSLSDKSIADDAGILDETAVDEIAPEIIMLVSEAMDEFAIDVSEVLTTALDISEEELSEVMESLDVTYADMFNPQNVVKVMVDASDTTDSVSLVLDENLSDALSQVRTLTSKVSADTGLEPQQLSEVVSRQDIVLAESEEVDIAIDVSGASDMAAVTAASDGEIDSSFDVNTADTDVDAEVVKDIIRSDISRPEKNADREKATDETAQVADTTSVESTTTQVSSRNDNGGSFRQRDGRDRQDNMNDMINAAAIDNQNVNVEVTGEVPQQAPLNRFQTMTLINQIAEAARVNISEESTTLEMILNPESLGRIYLNVSQKQGALKAQLVAENEAVKEALENQMVALKENLNKAGIKVEAVEVSVGTKAFERSLEENLHQQEEQTRQQQEREGHTRRRVSINLNNLDELQGLMTEEEMLAAQMMRDRGNSMSLQA